jgi:hypothetical protein
MILKRLRQAKKETTTQKNKIFPITNIFKRYKIIDLTRPNKLSTTTNKVATRSIERTQL